ncbi:MAG: family transcriptional regulator [Rubritepida sp.]|nr:family transcriptional regulator [Rubritepida sp.]
MSTAFDPRDQLRANELGQRLRQLRVERGLTLVELSRRCEVAISTLSKIENGQVSPVYGTLRKIAVGLRIAFERLVAQPQSSSDGECRALTLQGQTSDFSTGRYDYQMHAGSLASKAMLPIIMTIRARSAPVEADMSSHEGEEFLFLLEGQVEIYLEREDPVRLRPGESLYINSRQRHGFVSVGVGDARLLTVTYDPEQRVNEREILPPNMEDA